MVHISVRYPVIMSSRLFVLLAKMATFFFAMTNGSRQGWFDCTGASTSDAVGIRRAYRRAALGAHPDKNDDGAESMRSWTDLRDSFRLDPLRFPVFRAMFGDARLQPMSDLATDLASPMARGLGEDAEGQSSSGADSSELRTTAGVVEDAADVGGDAIRAGPALVRAASATVERDAEGWPYVVAEVAVDAVRDHASAIPPGARWSFLFGQRGQSTVHYRGDERRGGYDVCCDFVKDSRCRRRAVQEGNSTVDLDGRAFSIGADQTDKETGEERASYEQTDCPVSLPAVFRVRRPLHQDAAGQWGAALQVRDGSGRELLCAAFAFPVRGGERSSATGVGRSTGRFGDGDVPPGDSGKAPTNSSSAAGDDAGPTDGPANSRGAPPLPERPISFELLKGGSYCEDGADLLEGPLDNYGGVSTPLSGVGSAESGLYGGRCREKCRKRPRCKFFTIYSSGWCQLSTRCDRLRPAGDYLTLTFRKGGGGHDENRSRRNEEL